LRTIGTAVLLLTGSCEGKTEVLEVCEGKTGVLDVWDVGEGKAKVLTYSRSVKAWGTRGLTQVKAVLRCPWSGTSVKTRLRDSRSVNARMRYSTCVKARRRYSRSGTSVKARLRY